MAATYLIGAFNKMLRFFILALQGLRTLDGLMSMPSLTLHRWT